MFRLIKSIIESNKEFILLILLFFTIVTIINSSFLFPIVVSIVISYFLHNLKKIFLIFGASKKVAFIFSYFSFFSLFLLILVILAPIVFKQSVALFNDLPLMVQKVKILTDKFVDKYLFIFPIEQTDFVFSNIITYIRSIGKVIISISLFSIIIIIKWTVYIFSIPIFTFFLLKDYEDMVDSFKKIMPQKAIFLGKIWGATNKQIGNYVRGKFIELVIVTIINYILFRTYNITYAYLLSFCVGLSVIMPYIGTIIVSIPIFLISSVQLGISYTLFNFLFFYFVIQFFDGNLLVPILFSGAVQLSSITIVMSIVVFGCIFKLYGVVFAIPLAVFTKAVIVLYLSPDEH